MELKKAEIEVTVDLDGEIKFEGKGYKGGKCHKDIAPLLDGLEITEVKKKPEYFQKEVVKKKVTG